MGRGLWSAKTRTGSVGHESWGGGGGPPPPQRPPWHRRLRGDIQNVDAAEARSRVDHAVRRRRERKHIPRSEGPDSARAPSLHESVVDREEGLQLVEALLGVRGVALHGDAPAAPEIPARTGHARRDVEDARVDGHGLDAAPLPAGARRPGEGAEGAVPDEGEPVVGAQGHLVSRTEREDAAHRRHRRVPQVLGRPAVDPGIAQVERRRHLRHGPAQPREARVVDRYAPHLGSGRRPREEARESGGRRRCGGGSSLLRPRIVKRLRHEEGPHQRRVEGRVRDRSTRAPRDDRFGRQRREPTPHVKRVGIPESGGHTRPRETHSRSLQRRQDAARGAPGHGETGRRSHDGASVSLAPVSLDAVSCGSTQPNGRACTGIVRFVWFGSFVRTRSRPS